MNFEIETFENPKCFVSCLFNIHPTSVESQENPRTESCEYSLPHPSAQQIPAAVSVVFLLDSKVKSKQSLNYLK